MKSKNPFRIVAIDGPAGAGKSTVAKELARRLGYLYLDTGAFYRATGLYFSRLGVDVKNLKEIQAALSKLDLRLEKEHVFLDGKDVSKEIRTREVSAQAASIATIPEVRSKLVTIQQAFGRGEGIVPAPKGLVAEGRDIGSVVFPKADFKFFVTANLETRAKRRHQEFTKDGQVLPLKTVMEEIAKRDKSDSTRKIAPLIKAADAIEVDTSTLSIEESIQMLQQKVESAAE